jgi:hypothetical protein
MSGDPPARPAASYDTSLPVGRHHPSDLGTGRPNAGRFMHGPEPWPSDAGFICQGAPAPALRNSKGRAHYEYPMDVSREGKMEGSDVKATAREMLATISDDVKREIVGKSRWTCESNWMMALVFAAGWDVANKTNIQVGQAVGKAEMHRLMKALGIERPKNDGELMMLVTLAMETFVTKDYFDYEFTIAGPGRIRGIVRKCYAYTKVSSIGVEHDYQCGCFGMRAGWYEAMGVEVKENMVTCLKDGADRCEIITEEVVYP